MLIISNEIDKNLLHSLNTDSNFDYIKGYYIDRINKTGVLSELKSNADIFKQFEFESNITRDICKGCNTKISLAKTKVLVSTGHHQLHENIIKDNKFVFYNQKLKVHHFKWNADLIRKIKLRDGQPSTPETKLFLNYYNSNNQRMNILDPAFSFKEGWHTSEDKMRWSSSRSIIQFPDKGCKRVFFKIEGMPESIKKEEQILSIKVDSIHYSDIILNKEVEVKINKKNIKKIEMSSNISFVPQLLGINDDQRELSFIIKDFKFMKQDR